MATTTRRRTVVISAELRAVVDAMLVLQADARARIRHLEELETLEPIVQ